MSKFLKRKITTVFIMLGNSCNMNCKYCLQHPLVTEQLTSKINPDIYEFLKECADELNEGTKLHIQFYGGEPLLYFDIIKEVVSKTKEYCWYSVITNGKAITDEMVDFFNDNKMPVTISWDGKNVLETRRLDVFTDVEHKARLLKINQLGLSAVMSAKAYPLEIMEAFQEISNEYRKIHNYQISINVDQIFDTGGLPADLLDIDYDRIEKEMFDLTKFYLEKRLSKNNVLPEEYTKINYIDNMLGIIKGFYVRNNGEYKKNYCCCSNGYSTLNMDLNGNLYHCHNTSESVGHITDDYFAYLNKILASDPTKLHKEECSNCPAIAFCGGGCKLVNDEARKNGYCKLKQAVFLPVLLIFQEYGKHSESDEYNGS